MKCGKFANNVLWLLFFGCLVVVHGLPNLLGGGIASWERHLRFAGILFAFGVWVGIVIVGEEENWFPKVHRLVQTAAFVGLVLFAAWQLASPSSLQLVLAAFVATVLGYFAKKWVPYI